MRKILVVIGTRPEAIKMLPLVKELKKRENFKVMLCSSGQHRELLLPLFDYFGVQPDYSFDGMREGQGLTALTVRLLEYFDRLFGEIRPNLTLVHGDTTTAFCAALSAFYRGIKIGHVEAGLRTYDKNSPYPEEFNRCAVDALSDFCFTPTELAAKRLQDEGRANIFVTGNTVIDALRESVREDYKSELLERAGRRRLILVTMHRRETLGIRATEAMLAVREVLERRNDVFGVFPVHANPAVRDTAREVFENAKNIALCEPLCVGDFHNLLSRAYLVLSDSGGIQEEASYLGVPVLLLRDRTERPEINERGNVRIVGTDAERIKRELLLLLDNDFEYEKTALPSSACGDGYACRRIANLLQKLAW